MKKSALLLLLGAPLVACGGSDDRCDPDAPNTVCTIAGSSRDAVYSGDEGPAIDAKFAIVMDSKVAPNGNIWVIDFNTYLVREIDQDGIIHRRIGTPQGLGDSPASEMLPSIPAIDSKNNHTPTMLFHGDYLYLAAWHESRIKRVKLADMSMELFAGRSSRNYYDGDGGPASMAGLDLPGSIAIDPQGNMVFTDQGNLVIRKIDANGIISTIAGKCIVESQGPCANPQPCPGSNKLACGADLDTACKDTCTQSFGGDGGLATDARFNFPFTQAGDPAGHVAYDHKGNLLIADTNNHRIRKVDTNGMISTIAGTGTAGFAGDGGAATAAQLNHPVDIEVAPDDTIYFTDVFNHCVRKIDPSGTISSVAGRCHFAPAGGDGSFSGDGGPPLEANFDRPYGIDLVGNKLYVSDSYNNRLRVVNLP